MRNVKWYCLLFFECALFIANAQVINNTASFRNINGNSYFRLYYENDFFTATDYYYSQGINLEYVHPGLKKITPVKVLLHLRKSAIKYGLSVEHDAFTPTSIRHPEVIPDDRPFAATLSAKSFVIALDSLKQQRTSASLSVGVIGSNAGGEWMQKSIHKWLKNIEPLGWENQIHNDFILNYTFEYEKKIIASNHFFLLNSYSKLCAGTLNDNAGTGFSLMIGHFYSPFKKTNNTVNSQKKLWFHFYTQPVISLIGYDATLQGSLFNHTSPYVIAESKITRVTFQNNYGVTLTFKHIYLEYFQSVITKEFSTGIYHRWGGIRIGIDLS